MFVLVVYLFVVAEVHGEAEGRQIATIAIDRSPVRVHVSELREGLGLEISVVSGPRAESILLLDPLRFVLDLPKAALPSATQGPESFEVASSRVLTAIRTGNHPDYFRLVFDLAIEKPVVTQSADGSTFRLEIPPPTKISLSTDKDRVVLTKDAPVADLNLTNTGDVPLEVLATLFQSSGPRTSEEAMREWREGTVSPESSSLAPGEQRRLRVAFHSDVPETELNAWLFITGKINPSSHKNGSPPVGQQQFTTLGEIGVTVVPEDPEPQLSWELIGPTLRLRNEGNISIQLEEGQLCGTEGETCEPLPSRRIVAGDSWEIDVSGRIRAQFVRRTLDESELLVIPLTAHVMVPDAS